LLAKNTPGEFLESAHGQNVEMVAAGIILSVVSAITIAIVLWMFWWAAREDGRDQKRTDARLRGQ
jgi:hypothetical protein